MPSPPPPLSTDDTPPVSTDTCTAPNDLNLSVTNSTAPNPPNNSDPDPDTTTTTTTPPNPLDYEQTHVHAIYAHIAPHFSATRHKPWPIVAAFLRALPTGSVGLDAGCGNGKYLDVNRDVYVVGSDRSEALVRIAVERALGRGGSADVLVADALALPHGRGGMDFAVSVAVVHHFSSVERRVGAVRAVLETLRRGGRALVFVWALEQEGSRRGWGKGGRQDVMVPWVMRGGADGEAKGKGKGGKGKGKGRKGGEKGEGQEEAKGEPEANAENAVGQTGGNEGGNAESNPPDSEDKVFHRYYHLYSEGELERDIVAAGGVVQESGYEKDNWWAIATNGPA